jgi:hypothetical protein
MRSLAILFLICFLTGCDKRVELSSATLPGTYKGNYDNGKTEVFVFKPDGTFSQSLSSSNKVVYTNQGCWEIDAQTSDVLRTITLHNIYLAVDVWNLHQGQPWKVDLYHASWNPYLPSIGFSDEENFWVIKQPENPTQNH